MSPSPTHPPSSAGWLSVEEAARRAGQNKGHLRRVARDKWVAEGKARLVTGQGKRSRYEVREDADPAFARVKMPEQIGTDLRAIPDTKRKQAVFRRQILTRWEAAKRAAFTLGFDANAATGRFIEQLLIDENLRVSRASIYNWDRAWRAEGLMGLVDGRGQTPAEKPADPFLDEVKRLYLNKRKFRLADCHRMASMIGEDKGWVVRSYKACQRFIDTIPKPVVIKFRFGEEAYVNECEPYIERDYTTLQSNQVWCGDHHQFDVLVEIIGRNGEAEFIRPWLTVWQDVRSRKIVGWELFSHAPNTDTILAAFRQACLAHGVPRGVYIDNGKDYDSYALNGRTKRDRWLKRKIKIEADTERTAGVFTLLGVDVSHAQAYHGQSKPVERFFGTLEGCTRVWETYCGNKPSERPEDLQLAIERGKAPKLAAFAEWFADWLDTYNSGASLASGLDGRSPDQCFADCMDSVRTAMPEQIDWLCLKRTKPVKIGQNGVTYEGLRYGQYEPALSMRQGESVILVVDDRDRSKVEVVALDGKYLCVAPSNDQVPFQATSQEVRAASRQKADARKAVNAYYDARPRLADDLADTIIRARAAKRLPKASDPTQPPHAGPSIQPVRTAFDDQLPARQKAIEFFNNRATGTDDARALPAGRPPASRFTYNTTPRAEESPAPAARFNYSRPEGETP